MITWKAGGTNIRGLEGRKVLGSFEVCSLVEEFLEYFNRAVSTQSFDRDVVRIQALLFMVHNNPKNALTSLLVKKHPFCDYGWVVRLSGSLELGFSCSSRGGGNGFVLHGKECFLDIYRYLQ